jgi:hypothetical protein
MRQFLTGILPLTLVAVVVVAGSIYLDVGTRSWGWLQRFGSIVVLIGAILGYRSVVRLGIRGVGGANPLAAIGKVVSVDDSGPVQMLRVSFDAATSAMMAEAEYDKRAGYIGAFRIVVGTLIWGYGDLVGLL